MCTLNLAMPSCGLASIMTESFSLLLGMQQKLLKIQIFVLFFALVFQQIFLIYILSTPVLASSGFFRSGSG
jgi:hypothetical protein